MPVSCIVLNFSCTDRQDRFSGCCNSRVFASMWSADIPEMRLEAPLCVFFDKLTSVALLLGYIGSQGGPWPGQCGNICYEVR
jgi:hypothetical protein